MGKKRKDHYPASRLRRLRKNLGISQAKLAIEVEVAQTTIGAWERGEQKITLGYARLFFDLEKRNSLDLSKAGV